MQLAVTKFIHLSGPRKTKLFHNSIQLRTLARNNSVILTAYLLLIP